MFAETFIGTVWNVTLFSLYPSKATSGNNFEEGKDFGLHWFLNVAFIEKLGLLEASNNIDWGKTLKSWGIFQRGDFISSRPQIPEGKKGGSQKFYCKRQTWRASVHIKSSTLVVQLFA